MHNGPSTLIVYGNCQAQNIVEVLRRNDVVSRRYSVLYESAIPGGGQPTTTLDERAACRIFIDFVNDASSPELIERLGLTACPIVTGRSVFLSSLYPFVSAANPYNRVRTPQAPWGTFPYGDQAIITMIDAGIPAAEVLATYLKDWERYAVDLDKLLRMDSARLAANDRASDITVADFILENFRRNRLFFTTRHPTPIVFGEVLGQLMRCCARIDRALEGADISGTLNAILRTSPRGPLGSVLVPIHPRVAQHFALEWYDAHERFEMPGRPSVSYRHFFSAMIDEFIAAKAAAEIPVLQIA